MLTFFSLFVNRIFSPTFFSLGLFALVHGLVIAQPVASSSSILTVTAKQKASLGVQVASIQPAAGGQLLASATVVMPPGKEFTVSAPYTGQLSRLLVGVGDSVKAGAALAQFTSPMLGDARRLLNEASLEYKNTSAAAQRDQVMFDEGIISAVRLQLSRSKQEAAQAQLHAREAELLASGMRFDVSSGYATGTLKAPLSGIVSEAFVAVGQRVEAGTMLFKLADSSQLQLDLLLSSEKAAQLQVGDEVSIGTRNAKAKIIGVSRAVDASQSARARATVTTKGSLQAGELVSVIVHPKSLASSDKPDRYWLVPARAVTQWRENRGSLLAMTKGLKQKR